MGNVFRLDRLVCSIYIFILYGVPSLLAQTDTAAMDTTDWRYRIGYEIGSWLPFLIIFTLALAVIIRQYRHSRRGGE